MINIFVTNFYNLNVLDTVCDLDDESLKTVKEQFPGVKVTKDFNDIINNPDITGVAVVTPSHTHFKIVKAMLEAGKNVYVEKPISTVAEEAKVLTELAESKGLVLMVDHLLLYHPAVNRLKMLIEEGVLGDLVYAQSDRLNVNYHKNDRSVMWDLAGVANDINKIVKKYEKQAPRGTFINIHGQAKSMNYVFTSLLSGLMLALILVYLLIVVNFQSWRNPFIIITPVPLALSGIIWMLFISDTTFSVQALMGSIMAVGVSCANSILVVSFATDKMRAGYTSVQAAIQAGYTRIRPVIMTASAMILGMLPMALGIGEGGEQNAPIGRTVIGGLLFATYATLVIVPLLFAILNKNKTFERMDDED